MIKKELVFLYDIPTFKELIERIMKETNEIIDHLYS